MPRGQILDRGLRAPSWLTATVIAAAVGIAIPVLILDRVDSNEAGAVAVSVYFLLTGFIAFNYEPLNTRVYVLLLWAGFGAGLLIGDHGDRLVEWLIFGVAAFGGAESLSRSCSRIRSTAVTDPLTNLLNRNGLLNELGRAIPICRRLGQQLTMVHIDLDDFKGVNDREGHAKGDLILRQCAENWAGVVREGDILARIGGDEFLLVLPGSDSDDARRLMEELKKGSPIEWSFGVAGLAPDEELQACVDRADAELYTQKLEKRRIRSSPG